MNGRGRNVRHKPQRHRFLRKEAHGPVVMSIRRRATSYSDQVSGLQAREGTATMPLDFIVQDGL